MGLFVKPFLIFLCKRPNKSPFGDVNAWKLAGFASWTVPSCFMRHGLHWSRPAGVGGHMSTVVDACDPALLGEGLRGMASTEGALCAAFHSAGPASAPALGTEIDCE